MTFARTRHHAEHPFWRRIRLAAWFYAVVLAAMVAAGAAAPGPGAPFPVCTENCPSPHPGNLDPAEAADQRLVSCDGAFDASSEGFEPSSPPPVPLIARGLFWCSGISRNAVALSSLVIADSLHDRSPPRL
jgi:hypothetical protein